MRSASFFALSILAWWAICVFIRVMSTIWWWAVCIIAKAMSIVRLRTGDIIIYDVTTSSSRIM